MNPISMHPRIDRIKKHADTPARVLLSKIIERAEANEGYKGVFLDWLESRESTITLRSICSPFGDYWACLCHANKVDELDAASIK